MVLMHHPVFELKFHAWSPVLHLLGSQTVSSPPAAYKVGEVTTKSSASDCPFCQSKYHWYDGRCNDKFFWVWSKMRANYWLPLVR